MRTDQLIDSLAEGLKPARCIHISRTLGIAIAIGLAAAFGEMLLLIGPHQTLDARGLICFFIQLVFVLSLVGIAAVFLLRSVHPGAEVHGVPALASFPVGATMAFAAVTLAFTHRFISGGMTIDKSSLACIFYIPLFTIVPFATVVWALRAGAPTHLERAGAAAGLVAGALGASACALPCADELYVALPSLTGLRSKSAQCLVASLGRGYCDGERHGRQLKHAFQGKLGRAKDKSWAV